MIFEVSTANKRILFKSTILKNKFLFSVLLSQKCLSRVKDTKDMEN